MKPPRILLREQAEEEIDAIARDILPHNLNSARGFYDALENDFNLLATNPGMGARRTARNPSLRELRSWPVTGYRNYLIFYLAISDGIDVLHVIHGARDITKMIDRW